MSHDSGQHRWVLACCVLLAVLCAVDRALGQAGGDPLDPERVAAVKSGMLINFVRYTTWPAGSFDDSEKPAPLIVTIVGDADLADALGQAADGRLVSGRAIEIRRLSHPEEGSRPASDGEEAERLAEFHERLRESHVVYFGDSERERYEESLGALAGSSTLTVSDIPRFAEGGGMLGLTLRGSRIAFEANEQAIHESEVRVSSQVLRLATIVRRAEPGGGPGEGGGP